MFHFGPHPTPSHLFHPYAFSPIPSSLPFTYHPRRAQLEQLALAQQQQDRREAEEAALLHRRERQLAIEEEVERHQVAAYQAAFEQQIYAELEEEWRTRARQKGAMREEREREAVKEDHQRRIEQQKQLLRRRQEQGRDEQVEQAAAEEDDSLEAQLNPFLRLFFVATSDFTPSTTTPTTASQPESAPALAPAEPVAALLPSPALASSPVVASDSATGGTVEKEDSTTSPDESLHRHYRTHLQRREALSTLSSLSALLAAEQSSFTVPSTLAFQPSPPTPVTEDGNLSPTATPAPKLAFQRSNAPFLAYEDFLVGLLSKIDAVSSGGDKAVKQARKQLVKRVDSELSRLDGEREKAWAMESAREAGGQHEPETIMEAVDTAPCLGSDIPSFSNLSPSPYSTSSTTAPIPHASLPPANSPPTLLNATTLASLASALSLSPRHSSSGDDSDETLSVDSLDVGELMEAVMQQAHKLGSEVVMLERAELNEEGRGAKAGIAAA